jgi:hypothetical protein
MAEEKANSYLDDALSQATQYGSVKNKTQDFLTRG